MDDRGCTCAFGARAALDRLFCDPYASVRERHHWILGRISGRERHRGAQGKARAQSERDARRSLGGMSRTGSCSGRCHSRGNRRYYSCRCPPVGWRRSRGGGPVLTHRRIASRRQESRRSDIFGIDRAPRRGGCAGVRYGRENVFREDGTSCERSPCREPFRTGRP